MAEYRRRTDGFYKEGTPQVVVEETFRDGNRSVLDFVDIVRMATEEDTDYLDTARKFIELLESGKTAVVSSDAYKGLDTMVFALTLKEENQRFTAVVLNPQFHFAIETTDDEKKLLEVENVLQFAQAIVEANDEYALNGFDFMEQSRFHFLMMNQKPLQYEVYALEDPELSELRKI